MQNPMVSFVVPCYKLAHLLPECVTSILSQSYSDLEVLIMDDYSPDNTAEVARSFQDRRVQHIRNDPNLGHLRNYNKGIGLARGKYVWLISADDFLGKDYVLERYIRVLEGHPRVGFCFCPAVAVGDRGDTDRAGWVSRGQVEHGRRDRILNGHSLVKKLVWGNTIVAASGLVRRECYQRQGAFPLDMPWAGDWYLWCLFSLHWDVAYFADPMVCYREHPLTMTNKLRSESIELCRRDDIGVPCEVKRRADELGFHAISKCCLRAVAEVYARYAGLGPQGDARTRLSMEEVKNSIWKDMETDAERLWLWARVLTAIGDRYYDLGDRVIARRYYQESLSVDRWIPKAWAKKLLLSLGKPGDLLRKWARSVKCVIKNEV
jgi:glycosyltransferase involved in cell wall biosynthesis